MVAVDRVPFRFDHRRSSGVGRASTTDHNYRLSASDYRSSGPIARWTGSSPLSLSLSPLRWTRSEILCKQRAADRTPTIVQGGARGPTWAAQSRAAPSPRFVGRRAGLLRAVIALPGTTAAAVIGRFWPDRLFAAASALCPARSCINSRAPFSSRFLPFGKRTPAVVGLCAASFIFLDARFAQGANRIR